MAIFGGEGRENRAKIKSSDKNLKKGYAIIYFVVMGRIYCYFFLLFLVGTNLKEKTTY